VGAAQISAGLRDLAARHLVDIGIHEALQESADTCVAIFGGTGSGIMVADDQNITRYVAASDENGRILETAEVATGQGPCTEAFVNLRPVTTVDVSRDSRWPELAKEVRGHHVHAVMGAPVRLGGVAIGTVDVYRDRPGEWTAEEVSGLERYAGFVSHLLSALVAAERAEELAGQLQYALDHRAVIERGVGYLMGSRRLDAVQAFNTLRAAARGSRRKIGEVATELLASGNLPSSGP
jgi:GAF domain-containing protein